ncbi:hypothetical protein C0214_00740 [Methylobacterium sp. DM1]|uniref:Uncharacterized protein n=1 Tax=Methylorubrum aminovorans TaxID=269069 RepID=A0ABQ4UHU7_9HYPH|nr:hypothetical protein [Methylorubrum aminovorans]AWI87019.1 hypothetical protein C0214_00740 [Methylobacterium sp. DM1]GJE66261.1 hypothetical protein LNAOJCKE_3479 [Methylorubrum aminovorans]GMA76514.1 hypothetical protein GCM10025880_29310 [Methylorubrum aminovorans]
MNASRLANAAADAYAAEAKPPLTEELVARVRETLVAALDAGTSVLSEADCLERLNAALDAFEAELQAVVGPRIASVDEASAVVTTRYRSEAGQPLRAFGGQ